VAAGTVLDEQELIDRLNETDKTKRWYVFPEMFTVETPPAENETEEIDGVPVPTGEEIKQQAKFEHIGEEANPALKAAYDSLKCLDLGVIFGTYKGQLNGMNDGQGNLVGIHIKKGTLSAQYAPPVKGTVQKMMVSYLVDDLENDANRDHIASGDIAYPVKNWFTNQPLEVISKSSSHSGTTAEINFKLHSLYGGVNEKKPIENIVTNDISPDLGVTQGEVYNETQDANAAGALAENAPGDYTFTFTLAQTSSDVIVVRLFKQGYHMREFKITLA
jgi:hypothetical protein